MRRTPKLAPCLSCGHQRTMFARRLCVYCYERARKAGELERFPRLTNRQPPPPRQTTVPEVPGVTYRQLDFWVRQGYLRPTHAGGTGNPRVWSDEELEVLRRMGELVKRGVLPSFAARIARGEADLVVPS